VSEPCRGSRLWIVVVLARGLVEFAGLPPLDNFTSQTLMLGKGSRLCRLQNPKVFSIYILVNRPTWTVVPDIFFYSCSQLLAIVTRLVAASPYCYCWVDFDLHT
jgi:hypothetical protein